VHLPYGNRFRKHRRLIQEGFNATSIPGFRAVQDQEVAYFLDGLSKTPAEFAQHVRRLVIACNARRNEYFLIRDVDSLQAPSSSLRTGIQLDLLMIYSYVRRTALHQGQSKLEVQDP
jgi:hypothetical protein